MIFMHVFFKPHFMHLTNDKKKTPHRITGSQEEHPFSNASMQHLNRKKDTASKSTLNKHPIDPPEKCNTQLHSPLTPNTKQH